MITVKTKEAYSEVLEILKYIPKIYTEKIPIEVLQVFEQEKSKEYMPQINEKVLPSKDNLKNETLEIIAMLNYNYWCENEEQKNKLYKMYSENEKIKEEELKEKYDINKKFEERKKEIQRKEFETANSTELIEYRESYFKKIINKIKDFFKKN